jgi:hypothetical protein
VIGMRRESKGQACQKTAGRRRAGRRCEGRPFQPGGGRNARCRLLSTAKPLRVAPPAAPATCESVMGLARRRSNKRSPALHDKTRKFPRKFASISTAADDGAANRLACGQSIGRSEMSGGGASRPRPQARRRILIDRGAARQRHTVRRPLTSPTTKRTSAITSRT